jgi:transposase InsO family protein
LGIHYRDINSETIKNRYPVPLIQETLKLLVGARIYNKLDVRAAYNLVWAKEGDEHKLAFRTRYGLFEPMVMQFGTTNASADFQGYINNTIQEAQDVFASAYPDNILIYSNSAKDHEQHVKWVKEHLLQAGLYVKPEKYDFHRDTVKYLGLLISTKGILMNQDKVNTVQNWSPEKETANGRLNNLFEVPKFLSFCNYFWRFIRRYSTIAEPLTRLTKKDVPFKWVEDQQRTCQEIIEKFTTIPILWHFDHEREVVIETDGSEYVSAGVLSQRNDDSILHPVALCSKKHSPATCHYDISNKELMALIKVLEEWRPDCEGAAHTRQLLSNHKNLEYVMSKKLLNWRQAQWSNFLSRFDYEIVYWPGIANGKADALIWRSGDLPEGRDERLKSMQLIVLNTKNLPQQLHILANDLSRGRTVPEQFEEAYIRDSFLNKVFEAVRNGSALKQITVAECSKVEGQHDTPLAGHPGREKTIDLLDRQYYWKTLRRQVDQYVRNCTKCQRSQTSGHTNFGVLRVLPLPEKPWEDISMDFVTGLPECSGFDAIWVIVDCISKMRYFVPCQMTVDVRSLADMFLKEIVKLRGLPRTIRSDRGPQFAAIFWKRLCENLGINRRLPTVFHPWTNGQTQRMKASIEQYLRIFTSHQQDDWVYWLPLAEFAANNRRSELTKCFAFFAVRGVDPRMTLTETMAAHGDSQMVDVNQVPATMQQIHEHLRVEMRWSQEMMEEGVNRNIGKMYFSHWKPPGVSARMWSVNLDASISGDYQTQGGHSCRPSE